MTLKRLIEEVERLKKIRYAETTDDYNLQGKLDGIKQTVEALNSITKSKYDEYLKDFIKLKKILSLSTSQSEGTELSICKKCGKDFQIYGNIYTMICDECNVD